MTQLCPNMTTTQCRCRPTKTRCTPKLVAGDLDHAGADQGAKWNRINCAHTLVMVATTKENHIDGEPARDGGDKYGQTRKATRSFALF